MTSSPGFPGNKWAHLNAYFVQSVVADTWGIHYISVYEFGYIFNLAALFLFVDELEFHINLYRGFNFC
jgi:hypothetical protein